jgi:outer membrane protein
MNNILSIANQSEFVTRRNIGSVYLMPVLKTYCFILAILVFLLATSAYAAETSSNIAVLNVDKLFSESLAGKDLTKNFQKQANSFNATYNKQNEVLQKEQESIRKQRALLSDDAYREKVKEFEKKYIEFQKKSQASRVKIEQAKVEASGEIERVALEILKETADKQKYIAVVNSLTVLYYAPTIDITDTVRKKLDDKLKKVDFKVLK